MEIETHRHNDDRAADGCLASPSGLPANIIRFGRFLRSQGLPVAWSQVLDTLHSVEHIDIGQKVLFYHALRCNLVSRYEHLAPFQRLFRIYWTADADVCQTTGGKPGGTAAGDKDPTAPWRRENFFKERATGGNQGQKDVVSLAYSPQAMEKQAGHVFPSFETSTALYASMVKLLENLQRRTSRRMQYSRQGSKLSLRRLLRKNIQFGGEPFVLEYQQRKIRKRRVVIFCDISGSMDIYTLMTLQFVHALQRIIPMVEVFFFGTALTRVTPLLRSADFATALGSMTQTVKDWGGGTRIGLCLKTFTTTFGRRWLTRKTIVMIFSDGWDRGETDLLKQQMAIIKGRAYKTLWFNPLIGTRDYQPICRGMRAALPFIDYFMAARQLYDFKAIGQVLAKMQV